MKPKHQKKSSKTDLDIKQLTFQEKKPKEIPPKTLTINIKSTESKFPILKIDIG